MKNDGIEATVDMMATYSVMFGISDAFVARKGFMSCPSAPPKGFAREATAVADTRPAGVNHRFEYWVGADSTKG